MTVSRALKTLIDAGMSDSEALRSLREALRFVGSSGNVATLLTPGLVEEDRLRSRSVFKERYGPEGVNAVEILRR